MILYDFSSLVHRATHFASSRTKPSMKDGKLVTEEYISLLLHRIISELIEVDMVHGPKYGDLVLCLDDHSKEYWRREVYVNYKRHRAKGRSESVINFREVFAYVNEMIEVLRAHSPWKVFEVPGAEADDTICILAKRYCQYEKVLIHSPDKDMIQVQKYGNIDQYSALTKKWLTYETKGSREDWENIHVILGDASDGVPRVVDETEFSESFKKHLADTGISVDNPYDFKYNFDNIALKTKAFATFDVWKTNKKGEETIPDVYEVPRFGVSGIAKNIKKFGSLDAWLDSHPLYREHYERNRTLVLEEGIPQEIINDTITAYNDCNKEYSKIDLETYFDRFRLSTVKMDMCKIYPKYGTPASSKISVDNCGW